MFNETTIYIGMTKISNNDFVCTEKRSHLCDERNKHAPFHPLNDIKQLKVIMFCYCFLCLTCMNDLNKWTSDCVYVYTKYGFPLFEVVILCKQKMVFQIQS